jgi:hypothetical protein
MCEFISVNRIAFESVEPEEVIFSLNRTCIWISQTQPWVSFSCTNCSFPLESLKPKRVDSSEFEQNCSFPFESLGLNTNCSFAFGISQSHVSDLFVWKKMAVNYTGNYISNPKSIKKFVWKNNFSKLHLESSLYSWINEFLDWTEIIAVNNNIYMS